MCHDVFYLPLLVAKISSRCLHPGKYTQSDKVITNKKFLYSNHIVLNWKRNLLDGNPKHSSVISQQLDKWQRVLAQLFEILADAPGFVWLMTAEYRSQDEEAGMIVSEVSSSSCFEWLTSEVHLSLPRVFWLAMVFHPLLFANTLYIIWLVPLLGVFLVCHSEFKRVCVCVCVERAICNFEIYYSSWLWVQSFLELMCFAVNWLQRCRLWTQFQSLYSYPGLSRIFFFF